jgi:hypothetical protein
MTGRALGRPGALITAFVVAVVVASGCEAGQVPATDPVALPTPTPTATRPPERSNSPASATPSASFEVIGERLAAGTHTARPFDPALPDSWGVCAGQSECAETADDDSIQITYTVPEGWAFGYGAAVTKPSAGTVAPSGMSLHFLRGGWLFSDPCLKVDTLPDIPVGPSADDFAGALAAHPLLDTTTPVDVTLGGFSGKYVDLQVPSEISDCAESYYPWTPAFYAQGPNHRWHVWSLDVDGVRVVIQSGDFAATLPQDLAEMHAIIESIQIEP